MDADVTYQARSVTAPKVPMKEVGFHLVLDNGLLNIDPVSFVLAQGRFSGKVRIDARNETPVSAIDMRIDDVDLSPVQVRDHEAGPLAGFARRPVPVSRRRQLHP